MVGGEGGGVFCVGPDPVYDAVRVHQDAVQRQHGPTGGEAGRAGVAAKFAAQPAIDGPPGNEGVEVAHQGKDLAVARGTLVQDAGQLLTACLRGQA